MKTLTKNEAENIADMTVIECDCGYHYGADNTFIDQVGWFIATCPSCGNKFDTYKIYGQAE